MRYDREDLQWDTGPRFRRSAFGGSVAPGTAGAPPAKFSTSTPPLAVAGLLFDTGDVLFDATLWRRWFLQLLTRMGLHTHYQAFYYVWEREYLVNAYCGRGSEWDALRDYLHSIGLARAHVDEIIWAGHARYIELAECVRPLPGVAGTLAQLSSAGLSLGAAGNCCCSSDLLTKKLERLGLAAHLSTVVSSLDLGAAMPDPANYQAALAAMSLAPEQVAFVGHDASELAGARALGMPTIAVNSDAASPADIHLDRFEQLPCCIRTDGAQLVAAG